MEIFKNKFLIKLIATICLFLTLFSVVVTKKVYASNSEDDEQVWGSVLIKPIIHLMEAIGDSIMEILHSSIQEQKQAIIKIDGSEAATSAWARFGAVVLGIIVAIAFIALAYFTAGVAVPAILAAIGSSITISVTAGAVLGTIVAGTAIGICVGTAAYREWIPDDIYLPAFSITAEEIFSNELYLFDIDFFDINDKDWYINVTKQKEKELTTDTDFIHDTKEVTNVSIDPAVYLSKLNYKEFYDSIDSFTQDQVSLEVAVQNQGIREFFKKINEKAGSNMIPIYEEETGWNVKNNILENGEMKLNILDSTTNTYYDEAIFYSIVDVTDETGDIVFKIDYKVSIKNSSGQTVGTLTEVMDVDLLKEGTLIVYESEKQEVQSTADMLKTTVSRWYFILRNIAILVLMLLLIYSGIRIVIGSTAGEKAKHKERIMDWLVAMCLVFVMHYIMAFSVQIVSKITELVRSSVGVNGNVVVIELTETQYDNANPVFEAHSAMIEDVGQIMSASEAGTENPVLYWKTDLAGYFRLQSQFVNEGTAKWVGYSLCYVVLVLFTLFFAWTYLKRVVYMAFLTMIAPLVAMTYPIDKIADGKAQAFDAWLKEYIFNLMIQPLHLLLYSMLITSAYKLASDSPIYALVAVGFMMPAEKLMRRFFGFEKAKTPGLLGGAAGAALAMTGLQSLAKGKSGGSKSNNGNGKSNDQNKVKFANKNNVNTMDAVAGGKPTAKPATSTTMNRTGAQVAGGQQTAQQSRITSGLGAGDENRTISINSGDHSKPATNSEGIRTTPGFGDDNEGRTIPIDDDYSDDIRMASPYGDSNENVTTPIDDEDYTDDIRMASVYGDSNESATSPIEYEDDNGEIQFARSFNGGTGRKC